MNGPQLGRRQRTLTGDVVTGLAVVLLSGGWVEGDGVPEGLELGDEPAGLAFGVLEAGEVAGAELVVRLCGDHDVR